MSIRFAAAWNATNPAIAHSLCTGAPLDACNDNQPAIKDYRGIPPVASAISTPACPTDAAGLAATLMHFARYGLSAAHQARIRAEVAHTTGDTRAMTHWLDICRRLDRRMACAAMKALGCD
ncbi:hypothetical protein [Novosphingobium sp. Leaf2]|uniref:hypothetical protein n=1 Tax=Novosphingobium sp. Leaf2 TaxID=1735670 RepID=UPI0006FF1DE5|nr:hypothetical protein [Novosphingobium sp. Leaf2]KQM19552.1 hypothetical protein ASE49_04845 [Novosphingobium sp. Leaf2]